MKQRMLIILVLLLTITPVSSVYATETGSIQVNFQGVDNQDNAVILSSVPFSVYQVADYQDGNYSWLPPYKSLSIPLVDIDSSSKHNDVDALYRFIMENNIPGNSQITNASGRLSFEGLDKGVYLIVQSEDYRYQDGYFTSSPFVVGLPKEISGKVYMNVSLSPKNAWYPNNQEPEQIPSNTPIPSAPQSEEVAESNSEIINTGDNIFVGGYILLSMIAITGIYLAINKKRR